MIAIADPDATLKTNKAGNTECLITVAGLVQQGFRPDDAVAAERKRQ